MSATSVQARQACGFTQATLAQFHAQHYGQPIWGTYFFTTLAPRHLSHLSINDDLVRCRSCGCTIDEHRSGSEQATSQKFEATVIRAATYRNFRKHVYQLAVRHGAYDEEINYNQSPISSTADLLVTLYFPTSDPRAAIPFRADFLDLVQSYGGSEPAIGVSACDHSCRSLTRVGNMNDDNTPDRQTWQPDEVMDDPASSSSSVYHNELTTEEIQRECLCDFQWFSRSNQKALWCHVLSKNRCRTENDKKSSANRLVMNWLLHSMFDDNLTNDGMTPTLSVYCATDVPAFPTTNGYLSVALHVVFKNVDDAKICAQFLRRPVRQVSATDFVLSVEKKIADLDAFTNFLRTRHDEVVKRW